METVLQPEAPEPIAAALLIVGAEDFSDDGTPGVVVVEGAFANAIMAEQLRNPDARQKFDVIDKPVRISRTSQLEVWCNGFYVEGSGVRGLVHRAARTVSKTGATAP